ncbi:MAG: ABC transporter ATP-binding protein [Desulfobacterales bacterium]|uniref:ABC transporter ATP-binding protein n=1 Tax=Candidatus Desulfatibia profunda TaxID=2841695 RepID=A0A8J6NXY5_9BACT|nr:ABC transporter ATP-binding protein [Candidatus Desulfatibia profunda]MBL7196264.1 ABC transporter ATP-binding protein [Desulfobacterales bacterium]
MSDTIIRVENLGKKYLIKHQQQGNYTALRDVITDKVKSLGKKIISPWNHKQSSTYSTTEEFWALKDISFKVKQGEVIGIIGRNGAGKSTLLKIISRITEPTKGRISINGRVASLLEVGTGFHPELTGRENIFLNGAILGMGKAEIKRKFDEIVAFAEIEKFIDTPVKRYSSGMYVRLAFAVAAHLEPEILLVDEVLAVGDAQFQKKCLGKMGDVAGEGRTILFVSHNMQAIRQLCNRAILISSGKIVMDDESSKAIEHYLQNDNIVEDTKSIEEIIRNLPPDPVFKLEGIALTQNGQPAWQVVENGKPLEIEIRYRVFEKTTGLRVYFDLIDDQSTLLFRSFHDEDNDGIPVVDPGYYVSKSVIPANLLAPVKYELRILATIFNIRTFYPNGITIPLHVERTGGANRAYLAESIRGKLAPMLSWETKKLQN